VKMAARIKRRKQRGIIIVNRKRKSKALAKARKATAAWRLIIVAAVAAKSS